MRNVKLNIALTVLLILVGCGQNKESSYPSSVDISNVHTLWSGSIESSQYKNDFDFTKQCIETNFHVSSKLPPYNIVIVDGAFRCGNQIGDGCFLPSDNAVYAINNAVTGYTVRHETAHWASGLGNEAHDSDLFKMCAPYSM